MVKQTFLNLNEEKQNKIILALKKEFGTNALKDAKVSNIVKEAHIARGSFYQYFDDLDDSYYYLINMYAQNIKKFLLDDVEKNNGDIILSYRHLYIYILEIIYNSENKEFFEKIFLNMSYDVQSIFTPNFNDGLNKMINHINITKLNVKSRASLVYILDIIESAMMNNLIKSYKRNLSIEKNIEIFEKELAIICTGILKNN